MNDHKIRNTFLVILGILLIGLTIALVIINAVSDNDQQNDLQKELLKNSGKTGTVTDYKLFFSIVDLFNKLDEKISYDDSSYVINIYDNEYLNSKALNSNNIIPTLNPNSYIFSHYIKEIKYNCSDYNCFYFFETVGDGAIYGDIQNINLGKENYLFILDLNNATYTVKPLDNNFDINSIMNNYDYSKKIIEKNDYNLFELTDPKTIDIIKYYFNYTEYILLNDTNTAKSYVSNYKDSSLIDYLNKASTMVYTYKSEKMDSYIKYSGNLYDGSIYIIYDYSPMKFKISLD